MTKQLSGGRGWLADAAADSIHRMDKAFGRAIPINSAGRTWAQQNEAYQRYLRYGYPLALRPGTSVHERGNAVDFANTAYNWLGAYKGTGWNGARANGFGWRRTVASEPWHFEYDMYRDVSLVQALLNKVGYSLTVDGIRGSKTTAALKDFQKKNGLKVDGVFGPVTLSRLNAVADAKPSGGGSTNFGYTAAYYKDIQTRLNRLGHKLVVDGKNGPKTIAAVKAFQKKYGLVQDGIPGAKTKAKLVALTTPKPTPAPSTLPKPAAMLKWRWTGIQKMLRATGRYRGAIDNLPGRGTLTGFNQFTGRGNTNAWDANSVKKAQQWLKNKWGYTGAIDGIPGPKMKAAWDRAEAANNRAFS